MNKPNAGRFFEDYRLGEVIRHAVPRTLSGGERALYHALYPARGALYSSDAFARACGLPSAPLDDLILFHTVFGKTVPDISLNAVANLGYAKCKFLKRVFPGDTLATTSEVIGVKENSNGKTGVVYVRWVMVNKRDANSPAPDPVVPELPKVVPAAELGTAAARINSAEWDCALSGSPHRWGDYQIGEKIDHVDGMTVEESDHMLATRLYQNTAKVHFNQFEQEKGRFGRRLIYGGHVISLARALSFNGLGNAYHITAINGGRHVAPLFAGGTVFAWSEVKDKVELSDRTDIGALRLVTYATLDTPCADFPGKTEDGYADGVLLELDYWAILPR